MSGVRTLRPYVEGTISVVRLNDEVLRCMIPSEIPTDAWFDGN